jgi:hypothetical protein
MLKVLIALPVLMVATGIWSPYRWGTYLDALRSNSTVEFYGKVTDLTGAPVSGAKIELRVVKPNWIYILGASSAHVNVRTERVSDANGCFALTETRGTTLYVDSITKPQLRFKHQGNEGAFYYSNRVVTVPFRPDSNNPIVFVMKPTPQQVKPGF